MKHIKMTKNKLISLFLLDIFLFAIGLSLLCCPSTLLMQKLPLEPGQFFRFRKDAITGIKFGGSVELTGEELDKALSCLESFRYQSMFSQDWLDRTRAEYSFHLQSVSETEYSAVSTTFYFEENKLQRGLTSYISDQSPLKALIELAGFQTKE